MKDGCRECIESIRKHPRCKKLNCPVLFQSEEENKKEENYMSEVSRYFDKQILKLDSSKVKIWFTSDTHFSHANIIKFCSRPFKNAKEMTDALIEKWNSVVGPDDIVFHLGDFAWGGSEIWNDVIDRLNGHIYLIIGNHDMKNLRQGYISKFESVAFQMYVYIDGRAVYMNHYPFLCYGGSYKGKDAVWQVFGHVHSQKPHYDITYIEDPEVKEILGKDILRLQYLMPTQYDVGVDNNNYRPISWKEVKEKIEKQIKDFEYNQNKKESWFKKIYNIILNIFKK